MIADTFILGNEANLIAGKRLDNIESINDEIDIYNGCCMFTGQSDFLNANPYNETSDQGRAWNLGYANKPLHSSLSSYKIAYNQGIAERYADIAKGTLNIVKTVVDIYGNIVKKDDTNTQQDSDIDIDVELRKKETEEKRKKQLITAGLIIGGLGLTIGTILLIKKYNK